MHAEAFEKAIRCFEDVVSEHTDEPEIQERAKVLIHACEKKVQEKGRTVEVLEWFRFAKKHVPALYEKYVGRPQHLELSGDDQPSFPLLARESK